MEIALTLTYNLKTRYSNFYPVFDKKVFKSKETNLLKSKIKENTKNWSDCEKIFAEFTAEF
ncbi:MAG: hypothetical protein ACI8RP_000794 [Urechidicola sp.]